MITEDGRCEVEIKTRIVMAKDAFIKRRELLTQRMDRKLKKKIIKALCGRECSVIWFGKVDNEGK